MDKKYDAKIMTYSQLKGKVSKPKFQRNFVWSDQKQKELIDSLKNNLPIGSLLLSEMDDKLSVIDGLQRLTTMQKYETEKYKRIDESDISDEFIEALIDSKDSIREHYMNYSDSHRERVQDEIKQAIIQAFNTTGNVAKSKSVRLANELTNVLKKVSIFGDIDNESFQYINEKFGELISELEEKLDISEVQIPVIIFMGTDSELAEVFTKVNSSGVKLSKYDIFAARWNNFEIELSDSSHSRELLNIVVKRYEVSDAEVDIKVEDYDPTEIKSTRKINLFEYAYALSKVIGKYHPELYKVRNSKTVDSLAFTLLAGLFDLKNSKMGGLSERLKHFDLDFSDLTEKILKSVEDVSKTLKPWITDQNNKSYFYYTEFQLASFIITNFKLRHQINQSGITNKKEKGYDTFHMYLPKHYLNDQVSGFWSGTGDSKLDTLILDVKNSKYLKDVDRETFSRNIYNWFGEENTRTNRAIKPLTKVFINYLDNITFSPEFRYKYAAKSKKDFDHIIPKATIEKIEADFDVQLAISSPGNVCSIGLFENRSKKDKTYYQHRDLNLDVMDLKEEELERIRYPKRSEIRFVESKEKSTPENYTNFLDDRRNTLTNLLIERLYQ